MKDKCYSLIPNLCKIWKSKVFVLMRAILFIITISITQAQALKEGSHNSISSLNVENKTIVSQSSQQQKTISGKIVDASGAQMPGVSVVVKGTTQGSISDNTGSYTISSVPNNATLIFSFIGMKSQEIQVLGKSIINVTLLEENVGLAEVVVVGYGTQKRETVTGAINSVRSEAILSSPATNISSALTGRVPGLTVVQRSGEPGNDVSNLKIRGIGTLRTGAESNPLILVDGVERNTINEIDANEIETFNVLKDASATAVFGVRGANGVILITTKTGKKGPAKINLSASQGFQSFTMYPNFVSAYEWATLYNEGTRNQGGPAAVLPFDEAKLQIIKDNSNPAVYPNTDWKKLLLRSFAPQTRFGLNISGGNELGSYFVSFGLLNQKGIFKEWNLEGKDFKTNPEFKRYNLRTNFDYKITDKLKADLKVGAIFTDGNYARNSSSSVFSLLIKTTPLMAGVVDGKLIGATQYSNDPLGGIRSTVSNPIRQLNQAGYMIATSNTYNLNLRLTYDLNDLLKGLSVTGMGAYDADYDYTKQYSKTLPDYTIVVDNTKEKGYYLAQNTDEGAFGFSESYDSRSRSLYFEAAINYANTFGNHSVTGLLMYNQKKIDSPSFQFGIPMGYLGYVGRATYNYANRYMFEANVGYNGSEQFAPDKRYGFFPAFSAGWTVTEEPFYTKNKILTYLKFRGSYGEVGNDKTGGDRFLYLPSVYNLNQTGYAFGEKGITQQTYPGVTEGKIGNPEVTWERAKKLDIGLNMRLFEDKMTIAGDYFHERRSNILWNYGTIPGVVGATLPAANLGIVENQGYEIEAGWRSIIRNVNYYVNGNLSFARNKIIFMDEPPQPETYLYQTGFPVGQIRAWRTEGFINTYEELANLPAMGWGGVLWDRGERKFIDINGDGKINDFDKTPYGYGDYPEFNYGINIGIDWKGFSIDALFQGVANVTMYMTTTAAVPLLYSESGAQDWMMERWTEERYLAGEKITFPRMLRQNDISPSFQGGLVDASMQNANYLRLRNLEVAYRYSSTALKKTGISFIRFYINGRNLLTFTKTKNFDPEAASGTGAYYPQVKVYNIGLDLQF
jgi:TonB-linked SusC/RagA family outer membrane protein